MEFTPLGIEGAWLASSPIWADERGSFREWFKGADIQAATGLDFSIVQANLSRSKRGVLRGIHYSLAPVGQAKWVTCASGAVWDVVVDIRPDSPTFKMWVGVELLGASGDVLLISEGLGHGFVSLQDDSVISYLLTSPYSPKEEFEINPLDAELAIKWPSMELFMSPKDSAAPTLATRILEGRLPLALKS